MHKGLSIALIVVAIVAVAGFVGYKALMNTFIQKYYRDTYLPEPLPEIAAGSYPAAYHLDDVPWIATQAPVCQSNSLQMIAAQHGIAAQRQHFDFLMGFTYGAGQIPGSLDFFPGTDPEPGFMAAAPYLGLHRRYLTTDDPDHYAAALRHYLAQGYPVRVALDMGTLYGASELTPHSEVVVGYDVEGFYIYETVCVDPAPCEPGNRPPGGRGIYVPEARLLEAVARQAQEMRYRWRYALVIFEPAETVMDLAPIWARNGAALIGGNRYGPAQGANVIDALAEHVTKHGPALDVSEIQFGVEAAARLRQDNAQYLRERFPGETDLEQAADAFEQAAEAYGVIMAAIADGIADQAEADEIAARLRDAASADREAGEIFLARGQ
jgi:hypothetical protein